MSIKAILMNWRHMTTTKKHVVRVYNKGITATYIVYDKRLFTEHEFVTKGEAMQFIRRLGADYGIVGIKPFDGAFYFEKTGNGG